jgi:hypothetical protein
VVVPKEKLVVRINAYKKINAVEDLHYRETINVVAMHSHMILASKGVVTEICLI